MIISITFWKLVTFIYFLVLFVMLAYNDVLGERLRPSDDDLTGMRIAAFGWPIIFLGFVIVIIPKTIGMVMRKGFRK